MIEAAHTAHAYRTLVFSARPSRLAQLSEFGIRVNAINLGWTVTESEDALQREASGSDWVEQAEKTFPLGRLIRPADVACTAGFLLSDASAVITGTDVDMHPEMIVGCLPRQFGNPK